jgi:hypothetical protein
MSEWWTYRPSSFLLFAPTTYYRLLELYNQALWPLQIAALIVAVLLAWLVWRGSVQAGRVAGAALAISWAWVAWAFLWQRYATINWAAAYAACAFALQAALLAVAVGRGSLSYRDGLATLRGCIGFAIFVVALVLQPALGPLLGRPWTQAEIVGLAPDPTAVATLGLLIAAERVRWTLLIIPLGWCMATGITLWTMQAADAFFTPLLALIAALSAAGWRTSRGA